MENQHQKFMQLAIELSEQNVKEGLGGPFGAVIVKDGEIIAATGNTVTTTNDPTAHAEIAAIRIACKKLNTFSLEGCIIYASCEPCPMCLGAIYWARIDKLYYANTKKDAAKIGFDDHFIYQEIALEPSNRNLQTQQIMRSEALEAFSLWKKSCNKTDY